MKKDKSLIPKGMSLLWDMCKECGINEYTDEELEVFFNDN